MTDSNDIHDSESPASRPMRRDLETNRVSSENGYFLPGRRYAQIALTCLLMGLVCLVLPIFPQFRPLIVPILLSIAPIYAIALAASIPLTFAGPANTPRGALIAGWMVILVGAGCDIYATISRSPDLGREANPVIRGLLDHGLSLKQVLIFGAVIQAEFILLSMFLWWGLLRHRRILVSTMPPEGSILSYFKAGTGAGGLSYRQWLFPLTFAEFPWAYQLVWWAAAAFLGLGFYRIYLALEWFEVVPIHPLWVRFIFPSLLLIAIIWIYAGWLRRSRREGTE